MSKNTKVVSEDEDRMRDLTHKPNSEWSNLISMRPEPFTRPLWNADFEGEELNEIVFCEPVDGSSKSDLGVIHRENNKCYQRALDVKIKALDKRHGNFS